MQTVFFILIFLVLAGLFVQNYLESNANQDASPVELTFKEWLQHTWLEIILNIICFTLFCFGIDIGLGEKAAVVAADGSNDTAIKIMLVAAFATATAIKKLVQFTLLPVVAGLIKARNAKKLLRDKMRTAAARK